MKNLSRDEMKKIKGGEYCDDSEYCDWYCINNVPGAIGGFCKTWVHTCFCLFPTD